MRLAEPRTREEWQELRNRLRTASPEDYPEVDAADFHKFKKVVVAGPGNLVGLPMIVTIGFLMITEYVLGIVNWGAIGWLMGLVVGAVGGGLLYPRLVERSQREALRLGRQIGIFETRTARAAGAEGQPPVDRDAGAESGLRVRADAGVAAAADAGVPSEAGPATTAGAGPAATAAAPAPKRPGGVTAIAVLAIIGGILVLLAALPYLLAVGRPIIMPSEAFRFVPPLIFGLTLLAVATVEIVFGIAALMLRRWAWYLGVVAFSVGIVVILLQQLVAFNPVQFIAVLIYAGILWYLFTPTVRGAFESAAGTPSNKLITALLVAIPLTLVVGILLGAVGLRLLGRGTLQPATGSGGGSGPSASKPSQPNWPAGRVVFSSGDKGSSKYKIFSMDARSGSHEQLARSTEWDFRPSWSPDGTRISFTRGNADGTVVDIFVMDAGGGNVRQVTKTAGLREYGSAWSPDGTKFLTTVSEVSDREGKTTEIAIVGVDGANRKNLTSNTLLDYDGAWSPDGSKIAFIQGEFEFSDVMVMDADGSNARKLTKEQALHAAPAWSPDGENIAYARGSQEAQAIWVMDADGSGARELTSGKEPVWSPDGEWIMFADAMELHVIRADGSDRKQITTNGIEERFPDWRAELDKTLADYPQFKLYDATKFRGDQRQTIQQ
ncbi:MAG: hypothetical protein C4521_13145, partial [Actinobacteria bacterium]